MENNNNTTIIRYIYIYIYIYIIYKNLKKWNPYGIPMESPYELDFRCNPMISLILRVLGCSCRLQLHQGPATLQEVGPPSRALDCGRLCLLGPR